MYLITTTESLPRGASSKSIEYFHFPRSPHNFKVLLQLNICKGVRFTWESVLDFSIISSSAAMKEKEIIKRLIHQQKLPVHLVMSLEPYTIVAIHFCQVLQLKYDTLTFLLWNKLVAN